MQNIDLICVGKLNAKYFAEGVAEYQKRLAAFASFRIIELPEEKIEEKNASDAVVKKALDKEGKAILSNVRKGAAIVAMCIEGRQISSDELAQFLADRANSGAGDVAFVIGSSHGLSDEVKRPLHSSSAWDASPCPTSWPALCSRNRSTVHAPSMQE